MMRKFFVLCTAVLVSISCFCRCSSASDSSDVQDTPTVIFTPTESPTNTPTPTPDTRIAVTRQNFPDSAFRNYVLDHFDKDYDEMMSKEEVAQVTEMDVSDKGIESLEGLQWFPYLKRLVCKNNRLTSLSLKTLRLNHLDCSNNPKLAKIEFGSSAGTIHFLDCSFTEISELPLKYATHLTELYCRGAHVMEFSFPERSRLTVLQCSHASFWRISVDVSNCSELRELYCENYQMNGDIFEMELPKLKKLTLYGGNSFRKVDLTHCESLNEVYISEGSGSKLESVIGKGLKYLAIVEMHVWQPEGDKPANVVADFSNCTFLSRIRVNAIKKLVVTGCTDLSSDNIDINTILTTLIR